LKKALKSGISEIENIVLKNKKDKSIDDEEDDDGNISRKTAEKLPEFFFTNGPH
jgi:hypothetical protein